jgi:uracil-DNA glycosylase family 4
MASPIDARARSLQALAARSEGCRLCPRLVAWREEVAATRRPAYADQAYWGRPVPGFGDPAAWLLVVGLAPGAHGSNRTGRPFTGDRSGEWLYASLHAAGLASQPTSTAVGDGLTLHGAYITACVRCAPPSNRPQPVEWCACRPYLEQELDLLADVTAIVCLGQFAYTRVLRLLRDRGHLKGPAPEFGHLTQLDAGPYRVVASYHPSQQNTFTGKLTRPMLDAVWVAAERVRPAVD